MRADEGTFLHEHRLTIDRERQFDPSAASPDSPNSGQSRLTERSTGDWSWKPWRDKALGDNFVTYKPAAHPNPRYQPA